MSCKFADAQDFGVTTSATSCINWCASKKASIILTASGLEPSDALKSAVANSGALVVASAGDIGWDLTDTSYPAAYAPELSNLVSVGSSG